MTAVLYWQVSRDIRMLRRHSFIFPETEPPETEPPETETEPPETEPPLIFPPEETFPEEPTPEVPEVPEEPIPQTGLLWWPVPVMGLGGLTAIGVGSVLVHKGKDDEE